MPILARLDKRKPHKLVRDFVTGRGTYHQDGKAFTEQGMIVLDAGGVRSKYLCPKCDFGATTSAPLIAHMATVHHASEELLAAVNVYVQNINRGLPADEGISWSDLELTRTPAQISYDEAEAADANKPAATPAAEAATSDAAARVFACANCPSTFKSQPALAAHSRRHRPRSG